MGSGLDIVAKLRIESMRLGWQYLTHLMIYAESQGEVARVLITLRLDNVRIEISS